LQCAIAGTPRRPDHDMVDAQLDREVHAAPPPVPAPDALLSGAGTT
jgi:hypothetical protein